MASLYINGRTKNKSLLLKKRLSGKPSLCLAFPKSEVLEKLQIFTFFLKISQKSPHYQTVGDIVVASGPLCKQKMRE
jgi:hypothetical protein